MIKQQTVATVERERERERERESHTLNQKSIASLSNVTYTSNFIKAKEGNKAFICSEKDRLFKKIK